MFRKVALRPVINRAETELRELPSNHDLTFYSRRTTASETALGKQTEERERENCSKGGTDRLISLIDPNKNRRFPLLTNYFVR